VVLVIPASGGERSSRMHQKENLPLKNRIRAFFINLFHRLHFWERFRHRLRKKIPLKSFPERNFCLDLLWFLTRKLFAG
jgi:hypothetical protein